ncbi:MAG: type II toxin-antitoxin system VapB family antitoxin [Candidatus Sulfotelmatobacter sp.]
MRTNIEIDDRLIRQAMKRSGSRTKRATVETALRLLVKTHSQTAIRRLRGKVDWEGNLEDSREGRVRE